MEVKEKKGISELTFDQLTVLRNKLSAEAKAQEEIVEAIKAKRTKVDQEFLRRFHEQGLTSVKTKVGTPYIITRNYVSVADKETFRQWVEANGAYDFVELKPVMDNIRDYKEEHEDIPPGLNWTSTLLIGVKKS